MRFYLFLCLFFSSAVLAQDLSIEYNLKQAIYRQNGQQIQILLRDYFQEKNKDPILIAYAQAKLAFIQKDYVTAINIYRKIISYRPDLNSMRTELAIALFMDHQDAAARVQLDKVRSAKGLPDSAYRLIEQYIDALNQRNSWQIEGGFSYIKTNNVENVSDRIDIENTGFIKSENMLPKKANGLAYNLSIGKDFNIYQSHYLSLNNETIGKTYWDNHQYDDLSNRFFMGYAYKKNDQTIRIRPFYDKRWYGGNSYHWSNGVQFDYGLWLSSNWQSYHTLEYEKRNFFKNKEFSGNIKTFSTSLIWYRNPEHIWYIGTTFSRENMQERQYSSDIKNIRIGWLQEYSWGISTKLSMGATIRQFKAEAILGGILPLNKTRQDHIYTAIAQLWKRDWHLWNITPKLSLNWKKQKSNLDSLYSYQEKNATIVFEKVF
ncbi:hypothetical protein CBG46_05805 [Actinobacillus succinogenes]|uniref:TPR repeat-containing protein NMB0313 n=1 Tax=Actinobacillus succinogenes (strain ATCC 55618 / DSM 22257 / CCUG 43843 / 130Z) TaxID=339671 RepID=A6VQZ6_ACTSZ|nr:surface lipoprotein assembly modifier [Actinobacillus succinogenes]ABR75393.1 conserved hypothetical protein [Actinobacillus succinogenes 130Z]PHI40219.1 hypothetical protein CBG46_05805 [Actinobacillus succinogenes]